MTDSPETTKTYPLLPVYLAAKAMIDFMEEHDGACRGDLIQTLRDALVDTDDLSIPEFLRRKRGWQADEPAGMTVSTEGLEDLL